ncbi:MAG: HDIG domain-containing protein [candidate division WOR-3 bacterium]|nr:HDIG domain-containing protein [candidate division WOR-3 bacterium]
MNRNDALNLVSEKLKNKNLFKHCLATEACLRELARHFGEDEEKWGLAGLLHDIDYEETINDPSRHGIIGGDILEKKGLAPEIVYAVKVHAGHFAPQSRLDWALFATDPLTGLIVASALMHPDKKLNSLDKDFVLRRFKEKRFAAGANRDQILTCKNLGLELEEFVEICLRGMKSISEELGL